MWKWNLLLHLRSSTLAPERRRGCDHKWSGISSYIRPVDIPAHRVSLSYSMSIMCFSPQQAERDHKQFLQQHHQYSFQIWNEPLRRFFLDRSQRIIKLHMYECLPFHIFRYKQCSCVRTWWLGVGWAISDDKWRNRGSWNKSNDEYWCRLLAV